eukprot:gnl/Dysnectes_brevis/2812_a3430_1505.p1 GENE.gnl/Dysnectes_brevis/2812_a3430_1505~~gnl/Dysnectes_brevis/2812_a3430_1505.p1  ORF type:complete len:300 (+),score=61.46 gnl/Dysnectes_brevis/2812_a3430_1505:66-965(+)
MSNKNAKEAEILKKKLLVLSRQPGNTECADCTAKAPRWACFNHGIFVCIKCSGVHRGYGRAVSKVKSITLDKWTVDQVSQMRGNDAANAELLARLPAGKEKPREGDDSGRRVWMRAKYIQRKWEGAPGAPGAVDTEASETSSQPPTPSRRRRRRRHRKEGDAASLPPSPSEVSHTSATHVPRSEPARTIPKAEPSPFGLDSLLDFDSAPSSSPSSIPTRSKSQGSFHAPAPVKPAPISTRPSSRVSAAKGGSLLGQPSAIEPMLVDAKDDIMSCFSDAPSSQSASAANYGSMGYRPSFF